MVRFVAIRESTNYWIDRFVSNDDDDEAKDNGQCMHRVKLNATNYNYQLLFSSRAH